MSESGVTRKLTAILCADVAGYSRLSGADEVGTHRQLSAGLDLISERIKAAGGRVVNFAGDAVLADFASVVAAVETAVSIQKALADRDADMPEDKRLQFRIGVNLGDVIVDRDDIFGDGVNVAARLEGLADPGGICVSGDVYRQVEGKLDISFQDLGDQEVKNIAHPVRVYAVEQTAAAPKNSSSAATPKKGSIAVLAFTNLSDDAEQEYFADGITEDIITALSNVRTFTVLARNSTFVYKGKSVDVRKVGRDLEVRYVIEGSVRRAGDRVRVTAQLIDTTTGDHLWAERYDGTLDDIFDLQDRITSKIVGTIEPELVRAEGLRLQSTPPDNMNAYDHLLRGVSYMHKVTPEDTTKALACFEKAYMIDPNYDRAYAFASWCYRRDAMQRGNALLPEADRQQATELARNALRVARNDPYVMVYAGCTMYQFEGAHEEGLALIDRALAMNPNSHRFWNGKAQAHAYNGETEKAIESGKRAISIGPNDPAIWVSYWSIAEAHLQELRFEEAIEFARRSLRHNEFVGPVYFVIAAAAAHLGHEAEAQQALSTGKSISPGITVQNFGDYYQVAGFKNLDAYLDGLRKAGLPEA